MEPITPVFLAAHGALLLRDSESVPLQWILVAATALLGLAGLAGWQSASATKLRAWLLLILTWALLYLTGGVAAFFTLWYFMLAAVYPLVLSGTSSVAYPIVIALAYLGLAPITDSQLLPAVLLGRTAVITAIGLVVAGLSAAQRQSTRELVLAKDEFIASVSHELRTPLTAVVGYSAELLDRATNLQPTELEEFATAVHRHSVEVANLVEDLLVAARIDVGEVSVNPVVLDIRHELKKVAAEVLPVFGLTEESLMISGGPVFTSADLTRFRQIVRNLVVNAIRYGGSIMEARLATNGTRAFIELADDGDGVPDADITRLFIPYQRFHDNGGQPNSIGLGLAVSRNLARLMDGDLSYHRTDGWSVFRLELPGADHLSPHPQRVQAPLIPEAVAKKVPRRSTTSRRVRRKSSG